MFFFQLLSFIKHFIYCTKFSIFYLPLCILFIGGFGAWSIVINAFISDTSEVKDRSMRFGMLKLSETLGKPIGALLGNYIINKGTAKTITFLAKNMLKS